MTSAGVIGDDKRNLYSPEIFLYDIAFDPDKHNLNSPTTQEPLTTGNLN